MAVDSGQVNTNTVSYPTGECYFYVKWNKKSQSMTNNTTTITWEIYFHNRWEYYLRAVEVKSLVLDGDTNNPLYSGGVWSNLTESKDYKLANGTTTIAHADDGSKTFSLTLNAYLFENNDLTGTNSFTLEKIPRYATVSTEISSRTETSLTIKWISDSVCDQVWYSNDDEGPWTSVSGSSASSGTYTLSSLAVGSSCDIYTKVKRKDSQLETVSAKLSASTYEYPHATATPDFNLGSSLTITLYNPLSRTVSVNLLYGSTVIDTIETSGTSVKGYKDPDVVNALYACIPNSASGQYNVSVVYGSVSTITTEGGSFNAIASVCGPQINAVTYYDTDADTQNVVQDTSVIVQSKSKPLFRANGIYARKNAGISTVRVNVNGTNYNMTLDGTVATRTLNNGINSSENVKATVTVTDTRGFSASAECTVTVVEWATPTATIDIQRESNFYSDTYVTVTANVSYLNGTNTVSIAYTATASGETPITGTLVNRSESVVTLNNEKSWLFTVTVTDALGKQYVFYKTVPKGIPLMFWDRGKSSVGINRYPVTHSFEVSSSEAIVAPENLGHRLNLVSHGNFEETGWYTILEFSSNTDNELYGIYPVQIDIYAERGYIHGNNESHNVLMTMTYQHAYWTKETSVSNASTLLTQIRWAYSTSSHIAKLQVYYNSSNLNSVAFGFDIYSRLGNFVAPAPYKDSFSGTVLSAHTFDTGALGLLPLSQINISGKRERTGDFEFFTVTVDRPLAFGGETTQNTAHEVECVLRLPESYSPTGTPTRLVLACHGASGYIRASTNTWYNNDGWKPFMDELLDAGYAVFDSNVLPTSTGTDQMGRCYGSPLYVNVLKHAYDYIQRNYNVEREIFAHGTSMGGVGASAFSNIYPNLVLAQSSFAGRSIMQYIRNVQDGVTEERTLETMNIFSISWGYASYDALKSNKWSYIEGISPDLSLVKYNSSGQAQIPPLRESDFNNWLTYFSQIIRCGQNDDAGIWMGKRSVPYKAWNSWADNENCTKLETVLQQAYRRGNSSPYILVNKSSGTHSDMSYGRLTGMIDSLIAWYRRFE